MCRAVETRWIYSVPRYACPRSGWLATRRASSATPALATGNLTCASTRTCLRGGSASRISRSLLPMFRGWHVLSHQYFTEQGSQLAVLTGIPGRGGDGSNSLRPAQVGAAWALAAHFVVSREPASASLPTGAGKTAVMTLLPYLIPARRVLVVVPTKLLRGQVGSEFASLATLRNTGTCPQESQPARGSSRCLGCLAIWPRGRP